MQQQQQQQKVVSLGFNLLGENSTS